MTRYFGIFVALLLVACDPAAPKGDLLDPDLVDNPATASGYDDPDRPKIEFEDNVFQFGTITQGEKVIHKFAFTNTGKSPLIITSVTPTCGCTVADFPKEPIDPGAGGEIAVVFKSSSKNNGTTSKQIMVTTNATPATETIFVKGNVIAPDN